MSIERVVSRTEAFWFILVWMFLYQKLTTNDCAKCKSRCLKHYQGFSLLRTDSKGLYKLEPVPLRKNDNIMLWQKKRSYCLNRGPSFQTFVLRKTVLSNRAEQMPCQWLTSSFFVSLGTKPHLTNEVQMIKTMLLKTPGGKVRLISWASLIVAALSSQTRH